MALFAIAVSYLLFKVSLLKHTGILIGFSKSGRLYWTGTSLEFLSRVVIRKKFLLFQNKCVTSWK